MFSDPYVCTIVITHAIYSINIVYTKSTDLQWSKEKEQDTNNCWQDMIEKTNINTSIIIDL